MLLYSALVCFPFGTEFVFRPVRFCIRPGKLYTTTVVCYSHTIYAKIQMFFAVLEQCIGHAQLHLIALLIGFFKTFTQFIYHTDRAISFCTTSTCFWSASLANIRRSVMRKYSALDRSLLGLSLFLIH